MAATRTAKLLKHENRYMAENSRAVKLDRTSTNKLPGTSWHPYRAQLKDLNTIVMRRYSDSVPDDAVGRALVDQVIARIRFLAKRDRVPDFGRREAEIFRINYAPWVDLGDFTFDGYDQQPLGSKPLGEALELTSREKLEWGITHIQAFDFDPEIEELKAQRKQDQAKAAYQRRKQKNETEKLKIKEQVAMLARDLRAKGYSNQAVADMLNAMSIATPSRKGRWHAKMVTELLGPDMTAAERAEAKRQADAQRQFNARVRKLAEREHQRLQTHAKMLATVTARIIDLKEQDHGFRAIARTLNEEGAPTLSGKGEWSDNSVRRVFERVLRASATNASRQTSPANTYCVVTLA